jgi:hypothetical protein
VFVNICGNNSYLKVGNSEMQLDLKENVLRFSFFLPGKELRCLEINFC